MGGQIIRQVYRSEPFHEWLEKNWVGGVPEDCMNAIGDKDCRNQRIRKCDSCQYYSEMMDIYYFGKILESTKRGQ